MKKMREEDGARYLSPLVKQDLAKLDTDGDTRRLAVQSLKLVVEQLDAATLPRFISQVPFPLNARLSLEMHSMYACLRLENHGSAF